jgi:hypothetical protein
VILTTCVENVDLFVFEVAEEKFGIVFASDAANFTIVKITHRNFYNYEAQISIMAEYQKGEIIVEPFFTVYSAILVGLSNVLSK